MWYDSNVDIIIDQGDIIYRYWCNEQCDRCPMRYICYTNKHEDNILRLVGHSYIDLLMVRARLDSLINNQEFLCPICYKMDQKDVARRLGEECPECGHYMTCERCGVHDCEFIHDLYNTDGDCLMTK